MTNEGSAPGLDLTAREYGSGQKVFGRYTLIKVLGRGLHYLALAGSTPGASNVANYGMLKLSPLWEPLRGDPRFEKFVAAKAPK